MLEKWKNNYCLVGPYLPDKVSAEFEEIEESNSPFYKAIVRMREIGLQAHYGVWLVSGRPKVVLVDLESVRSRQVWSLGATWNINTGWRFSIERCDCFWRAGENISD